MTVLNLPQWTKLPTTSSTYRVANHDVQNGWAMFPAKGLYAQGRVTAFANFHLRQAAELNALKLYFLFAARRSTKTNLAHIGYDKIHKYTAIPLERIKPALSLLTLNGLVYTENFPSKWSEQGLSNAYRLVHLNTRRHMGTTGRGMDALDFDQAENTFE